MVAKPLNRMVGGRQVSSLGKTNGKPEAAKPQKSGSTTTGSGGSGQKRDGSERPRTVRTKAGDVTVEVRAGANALTIDGAKELLGWRLATGTEEGKLRSDKGMIVFGNNSTNRPFRPGLSRRYMLEYLRGKWQLNGETIIIDRKGKVQSGQHRLVGLILAEESRLKDPKHWERYVGSKPLTMECIVVRGISDEPSVIDTIDQGQKRTGGDVFFRQDRFQTITIGEGKNAKQIAATDKTRQKLCNILMGAVRLVWIRAGGKSVSDAKHFPISEATEFALAHHRIEDIVLTIFGLDGGMGGEAIGQYISLAYAAGLYYLMATSSTDPDEYEEARKSGVESEVVDFKLEKKAKEFWQKFASGANLQEGDPILVLRNLLRPMDAGSGKARDEIIGMVIKAFNCWVDGKKTVKPKDIQLVKRNVDGKESLAEAPRLGGIDTEGPEKETSDEPPGGRRSSLGEAEAYDPADDTREGSKAGKKWAEGDTAWVKGMGGNENYYGTIEEYIKGDGCPDSVIIRDDAGKSWQEDVKQLSVKYPG